MTPSSNQPAEDRKARILVTDDEKSIRDILKDALRGEGYHVEEAADGLEAIEKIKANDYDVCLTDMKMPNADGMEVLRHIGRECPSMKCLMITAFGTIDMAVEAMKLGAFDFITKPFHLNDISIKIKKALEYRELVQENQMLKEENTTLKGNFRFKNIVGDSPKMRQMFELMRVVANDENSTVLITGDSGTGKELVARAIHYNGPRQNKPLIPVNCGALPETLLESELFGHVKGAFTGAHTNRTGRFELANGGTIFLDEIGEMSPALQVKILRVLQEQEFEPVGSIETVKVNVRVMAATNRDLEEMVKEGQFREDLFFRLNVIPIHLPPLRERREDIPRLLDHFVQSFNKEKRKKIAGFSDDAIECLSNYAWRGNVRELQNLVERMATLYSEGVIEMEQLPEKFRQGVSSSASIGGLTEIPDDGLDLNKLVEDFETQLIEKAMAKSNGVKNRAARLLNIKRTTLVEKMKKRMNSDPTLFSGPYA